MGSVTCPEAGKDCVEMALPWLQKKINEYWDSRNIRSLPNVDEVELSFSFRPQELKFPFTDGKCKSCFVAYKIGSPASLSFTKIKLTNSDA